VDGADGHAGATPVLVQLLPPADIMPLAMCQLGIAQAMMATVNAANVFQCHMHCRICVASILGYYLLTWATSVLPASQVASFQALQPLMGTVLSFLFLGERPTAWDLGGIGVISGLVLVTHDARDSQKQRELTHLPTRSKVHHQRHI
jgi:threonine/homoserine efflux transporter RhtA